MSISSCNELCSIKFSSSYWVLILYYIHALISGIDNLSSLRGYAIEVAKCSRCLPEFSITRCERFLGSRIWHVFFQVVLWFNISACLWHGVDTNQISDGEGYLERTFLSPASIRATAVIINWMKDAGLTTYVSLLAVVFSRFGLD